MTGWFVPLDLCVCRCVFMCMFMCVCMACPCPPLPFSFFSLVPWCLALSLQRQMSGSPSSKPGLMSYGGGTRLALEESDSLDSLSMSTPSCSRPRESLTCCRSCTDCTQPSTPPLTATMIFSGQMLTLRRLTTTLLTFKTGYLYLHSCIFGAASVLTWCTA